MEAFRSTDQPYGGLANSLFTRAISSFPDAQGATGIEKVIFLFCMVLLKMYDSLDRIFFGIPQPRISLLRRSVLNIRIPKNPLKLGIIPIVKALASIDFCAFVQYGRNKMNLAKFNPRKQPKTTDPKLVKVKWDLQKAAYDAMLILDNKGGDYLYANNDNEKNKLFKAVFQVRRILEDALVKAVSEPGTTYGTTTDMDAMIVVYPQLSLLKQIVRNAFKFLDQYTDFRQLSDSQWAKVTKTAATLRKVCVIIQALTIPEAFLADMIADGLTPGLVSLIKKLQDLIRPENAIPLLRNIVRVLQAILRICQLILRIVNLITFIIVLLILILKILKIVIKFLLILPIPNIFTTTGVTNTFSKIIGDLTKFIDKMIDRLSQILFFLSLVRLVLTELVKILTQLIFWLNRLIAAISGCPYIDSTIVNDLVIMKNALQDVNDQFYIFLKNKENNDAANGTYNPDVTPIDQVLTTATDVDASGLSAELGIPSPFNGNKFSNPYNPSTGSAAFPSGSQAFGTGSAVPNQLNRDELKPEDLPRNLSEAIERKLEERFGAQPTKNIVQNPTGKIGEYTIKIITEEVVEKTFGLKRRYGVALNRKEEVVVQSTPTYASDSKIIIEEVKRLLKEKGLVKQTPSAYTPEQQNILQNATSFLYDKDKLDWRNFPNLSKRMRARLGLDEDGNRIPADPKTTIKKPLSPKPPTGGSNTQGTINPGYAFNTDNITSESPNEAAINAYFLTEDLDSAFAGDLIPGAQEYDDSEKENLEIPDLSMDQFSLEEFSLDPPDNEDENIGLGLNAFVNKLKGGKKLRRRMRRIFARQLSQFKSDVAAEDPQAKTKDLGPGTGRGPEKIVSGDNTGVSPTNQARTVNFNDGENEYQGYVYATPPGSTTPITVASTRLRADDPELAKQKLIDYYDPALTRNYRYAVFAV